MKYIERYYFAKRNGTSDDLGRQRPSVNRAYSLLIISFVTIGVKLGVK
jgi:hypothetical protein